MLGKTLGPYRIESELGTGGMGEVYLAEAVKRGAVPAGTRVALKIVHPHLLSEPGFFKRFLREAEIGKTVAHPNVVRCFDCDQLVVDGNPHAFLVMEYVEGQSLRDLHDELKTVPEELCRHIGREVSRGLAAIHQAGVIHRDLKPENVLITQDNEVKVMDLGVARLADEAIRLSQSGAFVGSVLYASPEQFSGEELDGRADLFSLGVVLYELSCGAHPHPGDDFAQVLAKVVETIPPRLGERNPQLSAFFEELVHALLLKDREERFTSATLLLKVLEQGERSTWWRQRSMALQAETRLPLRRIRTPRETVVYGRDDELAKLRGLYEHAKRGDGQVILIEGEAGIGKTRLVDEVIGRLQRDGEDLNFLFGSYPPGGAATASGAWSTAYREHFGAEGLEERLHDYLTATPILVRAFAALLRGEPPPEGREPLTKDSIQTVFVHATRALAKERTTVVLIEDLHFAPEQGMALFAALALAAPGDRLLLVGTSRPGLPESWRASIDRLAHATRLELARLGPKDLVRLLEDAFQSERLAEDLAGRIAVKSDGNPFFVFEIIRGLREGKFISSRPDGTWVTTRVIEKIELPSSVQDLIGARIAGLDEDEQELLDVAACCGFEFDPGLVAAAAGQGIIPALRRLAHLERSHRLVRSAGEDFIFDHHQVQEALYDALPPRLRRAYHAAIGDAIEKQASEPVGARSVDLAEHFLLGGVGDLARPWLEAALDHLENGHLSDRAIRLADRALAVPELLTGEERLGLVVRKIRMLELRGRRQEEKEALDEALPLAREAKDASQVILVHQARGRYFHGRLEAEAARAEFRTARDLARESGNREEEAAAIGNLGLVYLNEDRHEEARRAFEEHGNRSREIGYRLGEAKATGNLGLLLLRMGDLDNALVHTARAREIFGELGDRRGEARGSGNQGVIQHRLGLHEKGRESYERGLAIYREIGDRKGEGIATGDLGTMFWSFCRFREALRSYERYLEIARETGEHRGEMTALSNLGLLFATLGALDEAVRCHESNRGLAHTSGLRRGEFLGLMGLGLVAEFRGRGDHAISHYEQALALYKAVADPNGRAFLLAGLGRVHAAEGRAEQARDCLTAALVLGRELNRPSLVVPLVARLAALDGEGASEALSVFEEHETSLSKNELMEARYLLFGVTGDPVHVEEAYRSLSFARDHAPEAYRETMIGNVPLHRDIMAAWEQHHEVG